jgi:uncharacterized protein
VRSPRARRDDDPEGEPLPLPPGPVSNGEFVPRSAGRSDRAALAELRATIDDAARRTGIERRRFLRSSGAVAASLATFQLAACSAGGRRRAEAPPATTTSTAAPTTSAPTTGPGGTFVTPPPTDLVACEQALGSQGEFIFDVHTHHVMPAGAWRRAAPQTVALVEGMLPYGCAAADRLQCVDRASYLHDLFLASDTTVAMLSDVPNSGPADAPVPFTAALGTQQATAVLTGAGAPRLLVQNIIAPNVGPLGARLDDMSSVAASGQVSAFKVYTAWSPSARGWSLEDPEIGLPVLQHAQDLGVRVLVAHKGLPLVNFDPVFNRPDDIVAVSRLFPRMQFVVFHGAWDPRRREGPYDANATLGIDTFLAALDRHQVPPDDNVWVDLGTVWRQLLTDPTQAAHAVGKLLKRVGPHRVLWGTDAVWYGSPQPQIAAFRAFQISPEYQDRFGYPELTDEVKRGVFGLNAATLFGVDPAATRCALSADPLTTSQPLVRQLRADGALPSPWHPNGPTTRRQVLRWLAGGGGVGLPG